MDITNQLQQIWVFLAQDRFETVLKKMTMPAMTPVIAHRITCKYATHDRRDGNHSGTQQ
jgi:hypothetical protein